MSDSPTDNPGQQAEPGSRPAPGPKPLPDRARIALAIAVAVLIGAALAAVFVSRDNEPAPLAEDRLLQYCSTAIERDALELPDISQAASEEVKNGVPVTAGRMVLLTERMLAVAPDRQKPELRKQVAAYRSMVRTRDAAGFAAPELLESLNKSGTAAAATCKMQEVDFAVSQFRYVDFPRELEAGRASFSMRNESNEEHQMVLFRRKAEFPGPFAEILEGGDVGEQATRVAEGRADPDKTDVMAVELLVGDYALTCFIRSGPEEHWKKGEIAEFNVH